MSRMRASEVPVIARVFGSRRFGLVLLVVGVTLVGWFGFGLPPTGGPALKVSSGPSDATFAVAYPYLALVLIGVGFVVWGAWLLIRRVVS